MSGFLNRVGFRGSKKTRRKANVLDGSTPKPDRITVDKEGWNLEPDFAAALGKICRLSLCSDVVNGALNAN